MSKVPIRIYEPVEIKGSQESSSITAKNSQIATGLNGGDGTQNYGVTAAATNSNDATVTEQALPQTGIHTQNFVGITGVGITLAAIFSVALSITVKSKKRSMFS